MHPTIPEPRSCRTRITVQKVRFTVSSTDCSLWGILETVLAFRSITSALVSSLKCILCLHPILFLAIKLVLTVNFISMFVDPPTVAEMVIVCRCHRGGVDIITIVVSPPSSSWYHLHHRGTVLIMVAVAALLCQWCRRFHHGSQGWVGDGRPGSKGPDGGGTQAVALKLTWLGGRRAIGLERTWWRWEMSGRA